MINRNNALAAIYGVVYRIVNCDAFSREFLTSQGIDVDDPEEPPPDPYLQRRADALMREQQQLLMNSGMGGSNGRNRLEEDRRYRFLEYDGMVLTFDATWLDDSYKLRYFLADDTISITEVPRPNERTTTGSLLLKRTKVPKNWMDMPAVYLEQSDHEVRQYYSPSDLKVGETIFVFGRHFLLRDCDPFTRKYYTEMLKCEQPVPIPLPSLSDDVNASPDKTPKHRSSFEADPHDLIRRLHNFPKRLRYTLTMEHVRPEDEGREFVLEYSLSDGNSRISELKQRNSGRSAGCFLGWIRIPKPGTEDETYTPEDFYIGARLNVFGHWFIVTGTELFVYKYILANPRKFTEKLRDNVEHYLKARGLIGEDRLKEDCPDDLTRAETTRGLMEIVQGEQI